MVQIKQVSVLIMRKYELGIAQHVITDPSQRRDLGYGVEN